METNLQNDPLITHISNSIGLGMILFLAAGCAHLAPAEGAPASAATDRLALAVSPDATPARDLPNNPPPGITALNAKLPTIFIAGDSTAARGAGASQQGWGVPFALYFDRTKVNVVNRARGGRSSRTFVTEGLWQRLLDDVKEGDIVLIQLGENDGGPINDNRARGSIRGLGEETQEIDNAVTGKHEIVHTYGWYLRKMIADTKDKGATPIVLTVTVRNIWKDGHVERGLGHYRQWAYQTARASHVLCNDVAGKVADKLDAMGEDEVKPLYPRDHTHFNAAGADIHAAAIVSLLKGLRPSPVRTFLSAKGEAVVADRFSWLQLPFPFNPAKPTLFLIGDSTVRNGRGNGVNGQWGWGDFLGAHFDSNKLNVVNQAVGGTSSRTYITLGHWDRVLGMIKPGDFVMMQFGTNDNGSQRNGRNSLRGIGDETLEIDDPANHHHEVVLTFGGYLRKYIADTRARGATPIVCSLVPRKIWRDGKIVRNNQTHAGWAEQVATAEGVAFVDLNELVARRYDELGSDKVAALFADPHTHTSADGAKLTAQCVVTGLKALENNPLAPFLRAEDP